MQPTDILSMKCDKHGLEIIGTVCDEAYCIECSREYQEEVRQMPKPTTVPVYAYDLGHGIKYTTDINDPAFEKAQRIWK